MVFNNNRGEDEEIKTMDSTEIALNKIDDVDISSEKRVSRNLYAAINYLER